MDEEPAGTAKWIAIPAGPRRDRYELPLWMFKVVTDVLEDTRYHSLGLVVVRDEILGRLSERQEYEAEYEFISLRFLADLQSSLHHPDDHRRPWQYYRGDDESEETSHDGSEEESCSGDSQAGPSRAWPAKNQTDLEMKKQEDDSDEKMEGSVSDDSMTSYLSAAEITTSNEPRTTSSTPSDIPARTDLVASTDLEPEDRNFELLQATFQFLQLQFEQLKLMSESRKREKAKRKAQRETRRTTGEDKAMPDAEDITNESASLYGNEGTSSPRSQYTKISDEGL